MKTENMDQSVSVSGIKEMFKFDDPKGWVIRLNRAIDQLIRAGYTSYTELGVYLNPVVEGILYQLREEMESFIDYKETDIDDIEKSLRSWHLFQAMTFREILTEMIRVNNLISHGDEEGWLTDALYTVDKLDMYFTIIDIDKE